MSYFNIDYAINNAKTRKKNKMFLYLLDEDVLYKKIEEIKKFLDNNKYRYRFRYKYNMLNNVIFKAVKNFYCKIENGIELSKEEIEEIIDRRDVYLVKSSNITHKDVMDYWNSLIEEYKTNIHKPIRKIKIYPQFPVFRDNNVIGYWDIVIELINDFVKTPNFVFWYGKEEKEEHAQKIYMIIEDAVDDIIETMQKISLYKMHTNEEYVILASKKNNYIELFKKHGVECIII